MLPDVFAFYTSFVWRRYSLQFGREVAFTKRIDIHKRIGTNNMFVCTNNEVSVGIELEKYRHSMTMWPSYNEIRTAYNVYRCSILMVV